RPPRNTDAMPDPGAAPAPLAGTVHPRRTLLSAGPPPFRRLLHAEGERGGIRFLDRAPQLWAAGKPRATLTDPVGDGAEAALDPAGHAGGVAVDPDCLLDQRHGDVDELRGRSTVGAGRPGDLEHGDLVVRIATLARELHSHLDVA